MKKIEILEKTLDEVYRNPNQKPYEVYLQLKPEFKLTYEEMSKVSKATTGLTYAILTSFIRKFILDKGTKPTMEILCDIQPVFWKGKQYLCIVCEEFEKHISNNKFHVIELCENLNASRSGVFRKVKYATGLCLYKMINMRRVEPCFRKELKNFKKYGFRSKQAFMKAKELFGYPFT